MPSMRAQNQPLVSEQEALEQIHILGFSDSDSDDENSSIAADEETRLRQPLGSRGDRDIEHQANSNHQHHRQQQVNNLYPYGITPNNIPTAQPSTLTSTDAPLSPSSPSPSSSSFRHESGSRTTTTSSWRSTMMSFYGKISPLIRAAPGYHLLESRSSRRPDTATTTTTSVGTAESTQQRSRPSTTSASASGEPSSSIPGTSPSSASGSALSTTELSSQSTDPGTGPSTPRPVPSRRIGNYGRHAHDGVFANLSAKPEVQVPKPNNDADQVLPSYESAIQDVTPPYYQMTVVSPSIFGDEILVDGMPVGNFFQFLWNVVVASSFQFVGVLLTFLLHNTHASKNGSMVGLGMTLLNFGYHIGREGSIEYEDADTGYMVSPSTDDDDGGGIGAWFPFFGDDSSGRSRRASDGEEHWVSLLLMLLGWMVIVKALADYARAKRTEMIIQARPESERLEMQADREMEAYS
ncbi:hypothetical protein BGW41_005176 [Actinomortierella wolfii]|nr:hypothetical protein BGW41_005176 [Actinomortierella wolfii]